MVRVRGGLLNATGDQVEPRVKGDERDDVDEGHRLAQHAQAALGAAVAAQARLGDDQAESGEYLSREECDA